jgi:hypothetical protein
VILVASTVAIPADEIVPPLVLTLTVLVTGMAETGAGVQVMLQPGSEAGGMLFFGAGS